MDIYLLHGILCGYFRLLFFKMCSIKFEIIIFDWLKLKIFFDQIFFSKKESVDYLVDEGTKTMSETNNCKLCGAPSKAVDYYSDAGGVTSNKAVIKCTNCGNTMLVLCGNTCIAGETGWDCDARLFQEAMADCERQWNIMNPGTGTNINSDASKFTMNEMEQLKAIADACSGSTLNDAQKLKTVFRSMGFDITRTSSPGTFTLIFTKNHDTNNEVRVSFLFDISGRIINGY